jgi:predicted DNA-binding protein with PD1-like motif
MIKFHCLRLLPTQDLKLELEQFMQAQKIKAAAIVTCVGSLAKLHLRLASAKDFLVRTELFEIVSLVGTLSCHGLHLHLSAADTYGRVVGGHLMVDNLIHTTAEIVLIELSDYEFTREFEAQTGYKELQMKKLSL